MTPTAKYLLVPLLLSEVLLAQTPPCASLNDSNNNVTSLISSRSSAAPNSFAYLYKASGSHVIRGAQLFTGNKYTSSFMTLEVFSHDAASGFPGSRLAGGTWWSPQAAVATWQGTNLDKPVLTVPSAHYWLVWTETGWTTPPHEGSGVLTRVARRRGATSAWTSGQDEAAKFRLFCELLDGVNITTIGPACSDTNGLVGSLFTNALATVPNPGFRVEGTGLPAGALTFLVLGFNKNWSPVPLGALAPGCFLNTDQVFLLQSQTGSGGIRSASALGHVHFGMPIPSDPKLIGFLAAWQMATVDSKSSNALPLVFTNGLRTTFY